MQARITLSARRCIRGRIQSATWPTESGATSCGACDSNAGGAVETDRGFPDGFDGIWDPVTRTVIVRPSRDAALLTLRILHELAHLLLHEQGWRHSHGDVWHLTLALAAPRSVLATARPHGPLGVAAAGRVPAWAGAWRLLAAG